MAVPHQFNPARPNLPESPALGGGALASLPGTDSRGPQLKPATLATPALVATVTSRRLASVWIFRRNHHFFPTEHELPHPTPASAPHDSCWPTAASKLVFRICRVDCLKDRPGCIETPKVRSEAPDGQLIFRAPKTRPDLHRLWSYRAKIPLQTRKLLIQADFRPLASFAHPDSVVACVSCPR